MNRHFVGGRKSLDCASAYIARLGRAILNNRQEGTQTCWLHCGVHLVSLDSYEESYCVTLIKVRLQFLAMSIAVSPVGPTVISLKVPDATLLHPQLELGAVMCTSSTVMLWHGTSGKHCSRPAPPAFANVRFRNTMSEIAVQAPGRPVALHCPEDW